MTGHTLRVLDVGQCSFDHGNIAGVVKSDFDADVDQARSADEAFESVCDGVYDLVLVNRILDADGGSGLDLIKRLKGDERTRAVPVMLVSNYRDAQESAVQAGAVAGFGKSELGSKEVKDRLASVLCR